MAGIVAGGRPLIATAASTIALRATSKNKGVGISSLAVNKPTGTIDGDILVAFVTSDASTTLSCTGWTKQTENASIFGTFATFTKTAASEGASWSFTAAASKMMVQVICVSGATAVDVFGTYPTPYSANPAVAASVTPTSSAIMFAAFFNSQATNSVTVDPAAMTLVDSQTQTYQGLFVYQESVPGGSTGTRQVSWNSPSGCTQALIAIK